MHKSARRWENPKWLLRRVSASSGQRSEGEFFVSVRRDRDDVSWISMDTPCKNCNGQRNEFIVFGTQSDDGRVPASQVYSTFIISSFLNQE